MMGNRSSSTGSTASLSGSNTGRTLEQQQRQNSQSSLFEQLTSQAKDLVREGTRQSSQDRLLAHMDKVTKAATAPPPPPTAPIAVPHLKSSFTDTFGDSFSPSPILSSQLNTLMPPPNKSAKVKTSSLGVAHYSTIRPRKKTSKDPDLAALAALPPPAVTKLTAVRSLSGWPKRTPSSFIIRDHHYLVISY